MKHIPIQQMLNTALKHHQCGHIQNAVAGYQEILKKEPKHCDALHLLGVAAQQLNQLDASIHLIRSAIEINPSVAHFHHNLANSYLQNNMPLEALRSYHAALQLKPDYAEAHNGMGNALVAMQQEAVAIEAYQNAIKFNSKFADAYFNLGKTFSKLDKIQSAIDAYRTAIQIDSRRFEFHFNLGNALLKAEDFDESASAFESCLRFTKKDPEVYNNLGLSYRGKSDPDKAIACYESARKLKPNYHETYSNQAMAELDRSNIQEAEALCRKALELAPSSLEARYNLGNILREQFRVNEAIEEFLFLIEQCKLQPEKSSIYKDALNNLACCYEENGQFEKALEVFAAADRVFASNPDLHWNRSLLYLKKGDLPNGFKEYEWRWKLKRFSTKPRDFVQPQWLGTPLHGEPILLHAEQGLGDTIQFARYASLVKARGGFVILEVQPQLKKLLSALPGVDQIIAQGEDLPPFTWHCPLMSLPLACGTTIDTIPSFPRYLFLPETKDSGNKAAEELRVGIVWAGNKKHVFEKHRSTQLRAFLPLAQLRNVTWFSLQVGDASREIKELASEFPVSDMGCQFRDFYDTASFIQTLDLVITVDTSVAHLAGAMGIPVWILLAHSRIDWRWLTNRDNSPWYPSARLFRQAAPGDWSAVMETVKAELQKKIDTQLFPSIPEEVGA